MDANLTAQGLLRVSLWGRCNNNCLFCPANREWGEFAAADSGPGSLTNSLIVRAQRAKHIHFTDGELTVRRDLGKILKTLKALGLPWSMATNGRALANPGYASAMKDSGLAWVRLSLHGPREIHEQITGVEGFDQTMTAAGNLAALGVTVIISTVLTRALIEQVEPKAFARLVDSLGPHAIVLKRPEFVPATRDRFAGIAPCPQEAATWVSELATHLQTRLRVNSLPHCLLPAKLRQKASPRPEVAWTCHSCNLGKAGCGGFAPEEWPPAAVDLLRPKGAHPSHLEFRRARVIRGFNVEECMYRPRERKLPSRQEGLILTTEEGTHLWLLAGEEPDQGCLTQAKLGHGQIWLKSGNSEPRAVRMSEACLRCPRLADCPGSYVLDPLSSWPPAPVDLRGMSAHQRSGELKDPGLVEDLNHLETGGLQFRVVDHVLNRDPAAILGTVREVWLLDEGEERPRRPQAVDPFLLMRRLRKDGVELAGYSLPTPDRRGGFGFLVIGRQDAPNQWYLARHDGTSLQLTESCMCRCIMCNIVGHFKTPEMPLIKVLRTLEELSMLGINLVDLFGGEVTLRKDLFQVIRQVRWLTMSTMFVTTGYYLTPSFVKKLHEAGVMRIVVSIDGSRPEIHDGIRQLPGIWDKGVRALKALAAEPGIESVASTVILNNNLEDLPELVRMSGRIGIRKHLFFFPISGGIGSTIPRWFGKEDMDYFFDRILPQIEDAGRELGVEIDFRPDIRTWGIGREEMTEMLTTGLYNIYQRKSEALCPAPGFNLFITVNGNVYPCDMPSVIGDEGLLGNLHQDRLLDIITSEAMARFSANAGHHRICRMCVGRSESAAKRD